MKPKFLAVVLVLTGLYIPANKSYGCPPSPPIADLTDYPDPVLLGNSVTLDGSGSSGSGGIIKYEWDWTNNGIYDYNETPGDKKATHIYSSLGIYTAKLQVTEGYYLHRKDTDTCTVYVGRVHNKTQNTMYSTIQAAIDDANTGDTIVVSKGRYYENINFNANEIILTSIDPTDPDVVAATIIDGNDVNSVVTFGPEDADSVISGFTITNGYLESGGGIYCDDVSPTITNCMITGNEAWWWVGGGIYCNDASPTITNCTITNNEAYDEGGGIYNGSSSSPKVVNCTFSGNSACYGGGICNYYDSNPAVINCIFWGNNASSDGNEIYNEIGCTPGFSYSDIEGGLNKSPGCGGSDSNDYSGNIDVDPCFVDADSNDFHLDANSVCIDAGAPWSDYSKEPSPNGSRINVGTYGNTTEATKTTDADGDGISDAWERYYWPGDDPNQHDPNDDSDQDDFSNWIEYLFGYDPTKDTDEPMELTGSFLHTFPSQIDPTKSETVTVSYLLNMDANVDVNFANTDTSETVRTISQTATAGELKEAIWYGTDDESMIVERYFYDVNINADDGNGNTANWESPDGGDTSPDDGKNDYNVDSNDFNPYQNIPVTISCYVNTWCTRSIDIVEAGWDYDHFQDNDDDRIYHLVQDRLLSPGWNTFYWYGYRDVDPNAGQLCKQAFDVYFSRVGWDYGMLYGAVNKGAVLVNYDKVLSNLRCNPYRILPLNAEVTTITYDLACDANATIDTYDPDGNYFGILSEQQTAGPQEVIWYGTTKDPNDPNSRYISSEGVYRIELQCDKASEKLEGSIIVYK